MSNKQFIMEIEGFNGSLPFTTSILSYSLPELGIRQIPAEDKETGKIKLTSLSISRASDKYSLLFANYAANGKFLPKILLSEAASVWFASVKRTFLTFTDCGVEDFIPSEANGKRTENIVFYFRNYRLNP